MPYLPDSLCQADRWHTVIQGQWAHREHIMLMEGRSTLLCARREARNSHSHGCMLGVLSDNLSSTLAFDEGRSMIIGLLSLCRRMGAIVIGCRYRLRLRYVESDRNPADKGSRETGRVCRPASSARPTPSPKKQTWQPVSIIREAGRPPSPSDVIAPTPSDCPRAPPGLPEPVCRPSPPMLPAVAVAAEQPVSPVAPAPLRRPPSSPVPKLPPRDVRPSASVP